MIIVLVYMAPALYSYDSMEQKPIKCIFHSGYVIYLYDKTFSISLNFITRNEDGCSLLDSNSLAMKLQVQKACCILNSSGFFICNCNSKRVSELYNVSNTSAS